MESIDIPTNTSFDSFNFKIAEGMDISVKKLNIAYTLSTWTAKEPPSLLSKVSHLAGLFEEISKEQCRLRRRRRKGNNAKELFVKIKDLNEQKGSKREGYWGKKGVVSMPSFSNVS